MVVRVAGFEPRNVHVRDLFSGRITLESYLLKGLVGGFSYADVLEWVSMGRVVGTRAVQQILPFRHRLFDTRQLRFM